MHTTLITSLYQIGAIQFGEFTLKSGQTSPIYVNLRKIISYPAILRSVSTAMWESVRHRQFDVLCGVPYTALPIATCLSLTHNIPMVMRRKEKKEYGTKQLIEGEFKPGQTCLIIEDVVTTGGSIVETANELENAGLKVKDLIALIDREQGARETLEKKYELHSILPLSELLQCLLKSMLLSQTEKEIVERIIHANAPTTS